MKSTNAFARGRVIAAIIPVVLAFCCVTPQSIEAQTTATIDTTAEAGDADAVEPKRKLVSWNEYDGPVTTLRIGAGFLVDTASYIQDEESEQQVSPHTDVGLRDFRLLFKGRFKTKRPLSWTFGYMYDGADKEWRFRQTGLQIGVPEISTRFFLGRTKEGYSLIKVMVGYHGWANERSQSNDAFVPILADGVKAMFYSPKSHVFAQVGWFNDWLTEKEKFATYDNQVAVRAGVLPILSEASGTVLHVAAMGRLAEPDEGAINFRARPGSYLAPYYVETGKIAASDANTVGFESFYRQRNWLFGFEYNWEMVDAANGANPTFHGGDLVVSWNITGETRPYNAPGAFFEAVSPDRTVFSGGPGAWEAVLHFSYTDLDASGFTGGKYWRVTPMVNWHLSDNLRLEAIYGYGQLGRFGLEGGTHFFQTRFQATL